MIDRHTKIELYARAADLIRNSLGIGICIALCDASEQLTGVRIPQNMIRAHFPELWDYKPQCALWNFYWWDLSNKEQRIKICMEIIEKLSHETKQNN